jgi:hypothetical protein
VYFTRVHNKLVSTFYTLAGGGRLRKLVQCISSFGLGPLSGCTTSGLSKYNSEPKGRCGDFKIENPKGERKREGIRLVAWKRFPD